MKKSETVLVGLCLLAGLGAAALALSLGQSTSAESIAVADAPAVIQRSESGNEPLRVADTARQSVDGNVEALAAQWQSELSKLRLEQEESKREREVLRKEVQELQSQLSALQAESLNPSDSTDTTQASSLGEAGGTVAGRRGGRDARFNGFGFGQLSSDERKSSLQAVGIDEQTIASIEQRSDEFELSRLELIDQATRDGTRRSDEFRDELRELEDSRVSIRDEIGDEAYDAYLAHAGQDNRVTVESVINGSAASLAGVEVSDVIYAYAGMRIFNRRELQRATREGNRGEFVDIEVHRGNAGQYTFSVERGPLGVTLGSTSETP